MTNIKDFFAPPDLDQREVRYHTTSLVAGLFPIIFYSGFFIYFNFIGAYQFLPVVGIGIALFVVGTILVHYRKVVPAIIWMIFAGFALCSYLTLLTGWKYGFQFGILPALLFSGTAYSEPTDPSIPEV